MPSDLETAERLLLKLQDCFGKQEKYADFALVIVKDLKKLGVSWRAIGETYGVTHQAAQNYWTKRMRS